MKTIWSVRVFLSPKPLVHQEDRKFLGEKLFETEGDADKYREFVHMASHEIINQVTGCEFETVTTQARVQKWGL